MNSLPSDFWLFILALLEAYIRLLFEVQRNHSLQNYTAGFLINSPLVFLPQENLIINLSLLMAVSKHRCCSLLHEIYMLTQDIVSCPNPVRWVVSYFVQQAERITLSAFTVRTMSWFAYGSFSFQSFCTNDLNWSQRAEFEDWYEQCWSVLYIPQVVFFYLCSGNLLEQGKPGMRINT